METEEMMLHQIFEKCEMQIAGQIISRELLIKSFGDFLSQTISKREHNTGLIMHTGSVCFDAMIIVYAIVLNLISNRVDTSDMVKSFVDGDTVLYGKTKKSRYFFKGFIDGGEIGNEPGKKFVRLSQSDGCITYVSEASWRKIEPYNGNAVRMDGRGIRKKKSARDDFFVEVMGYKTEDIPSILDTSCVVVTSREKADYLVKNISLTFNEKTVDLLDLITASYYTEEDEYRYGGNTGKNEPSLKFASKVSAARPLLLSRRGNRHLGLIILGEDSISRGYLELSELINRKSLKYVYICSSMNNDVGLELTSDVEDLETFACTKEFLLENSSPDSVEQNRCITELAMQVDTIIEKENQISVIEKKGIKAEVLRQIKKNIISIKRDEYTTDEKDNFIMIAYSLMKLFVTAPFPMKSFIAAREKGIIEVSTPREKIAELKMIETLFPENIKKYSFWVIELLENLLVCEEYSTGKYEWLRRYLLSHIGERAAIVVPKAYYITLIKNSGLFSENLFNNKDIITANRFDNSKIYSRVIVFGDYDGKRFNVFKCNSAATIISVLYDGEKTGYYAKKREYQKKISELQKKSTIIITTLDAEETDINNEIDADDIEQEIDRYISNVDISVFNAGIRGNIGHEGVMSTEVIAVAVFDDDTKAYFSKRYKGYVLDETTGTVREVDVQDFCEGDSIVFTKKNDDTKDIVGSILVKLFLDDKLDAVAKENFRKANLWKKALEDFMEANKYTARKVAELMLKDGTTVSEQTILNWIDEDSHIVGPRTVDSIRHIGNVTGVAELKENPESIHEACREIRSIRRKILDKVGMAIVEKISGRVLKSDSDMGDIFEKIDALAEIKRVERIASINTVVPMGMANKPISI